VSDAIDGLQCRLVLSNDDFVLRNHSVHGVSVLPGVTYFDIVLRLLRAAGVHRPDLVIENVIFAEVITTAEDADREMRCTVRAAGPDRYTMAIDSRWLRDGEPAGDWTGNFTGELAFHADPEPAPLNLDDLKQRAARRSDLAELYQRARRESIVHGPAMRCTGDIWRGPASDPYLLARLRLERSRPEVDRGFRLHPAMLDASTLAGFAQTEVSGDHPFIPMFVRSFRAPRALTDPCYLYCLRPERLAESGDVITSDYSLHDEQGRFLAGFTGLTCKLIRHPGLITRTRPDPLPAPPAPAAPSARAAGVGPLLTALRQMVAGSLKRPPEEVALDVGFYDLGLDSLGVLALGRQLEELAGEPLYPTLLFEYSTIERLADYLERNHAIAAAGNPEPPPAAAPGADAATEAEPMLSVRTDVWAAEHGPARPPSDLAVIGATAARAAASQLPGGAARIVAPEHAASYEDILVIHEAGDEPVTACASLARLAASAVDRAGARPARITVACPGEPDEVLPSALAAVCRTITAETPLLACRVATGPADSLAWLASAVADSSAESQLHFPDGRPGGPRLVRRWRPVPGSGISAFRSQGTYLISGGAGGLGRLVTQHLADRYQARALLLSRRRPDPGLQAAIESWNAAGADVRP
jgi:acyl carrier protein